ncbi:hypothetical protein EJ05DRAFT_505893 [Pseudovirgaria hyperparasitica]|uniref:Autophagy-related protein 17 n=1 Tax=Pseudovirgaria hyperparasitica TaxID=470096 RepID=A0A6A6VQX8_9PEZI|nr:uncharacterized protein EJ05DRAFT_505893 [Pseudovirgaria hyperparasitica]KAF2752603.1 hypothetical protein EJ05DRAFT_505893 [Pseudovirgaria hyperparasitica]
MACEQLRANHKGPPRCSGRAKTLSFGQVVVQALEYGQEEHRTRSHLEEEPDLPRLVGYFVAAKRSILSTSYLLRANEIVNTARDLLEENAILAAKIAFIKSTLEVQIGTLEAITHGVSAVSEEAWTELKELLRTLDSADRDLQTTITKLQKTPVSPSLRTSDKKSLYDYIDNKSYRDLSEGLRSCIDRFNEARNELDHVTGEFEAATRSLRGYISATTNLTALHDGSSLLPSIFRELEFRAQEMAQNVQSLVHHYDLCVTALKHTDGGLPAASKATGDVPKAPGILVESLHQDAPPLPMTSSERRDMLEVVAKDAVEVEDVVTEMRDHASEMEEQLETVLSHLKILRESYGVLLTTVQSLTSMGKESKPYIASARSFRVVWDEERENIVQGVENMEGLKQFFDGFVDAYDGVLSELARRKQAEDEMDRIATQADTQFAKLYEADMKARMVFREQHGEFIPRDLWPGVVDLPPNFRVIQVPEEEPGIALAEQEFGDAIAQQIQNQL